MYDEQENVPKGVYDGTATGAARTPESRLTSSLRSLEKELSVALESVLGLTSQLQPAMRTHSETNEKPAEDRTGDGSASPHVRTVMSLIVRAQSLTAIIDRARKDLEV
jgi:hypothetical protein